MYTKFTGVIFLLTILFVFNIQSTQASVCGDPLDPESAIIHHTHYNAESNITVALLEYDLCGDSDPYHRDRIAIVVNGKLSFDQVDLYHLPDQDHNGIFFVGEQRYSFWLLQEFKAVTLSGSTHKRGMQVYTVNASYELMIDPTDLVLLQNGIAEISEDYTIARQFINGRYYYYPYGVQYIIYMPLVGTN
jgi:hypothetical protein